MFGGDTPQSIGREIKQTRDPLIESSSEELSGVSTLTATFLFAIPSPTEIRPASLRRQLL